MSTDQTTEYDDTVYDLPNRASDEFADESRRQRNRVKRQKDRQNRAARKAKLKLTAWPIAQEIFDSLDPGTKLALQKAVYERVSFADVRLALNRPDLPATVIDRIRRLTVFEKEAIRREKENEYHVE